jgi:hypothetical protein
VDRFFNNYRVPPLKDSPLDDACSVIRWYQLFIHVKLCRALSWTVRHPAEEEFIEEHEDEEGTATTKDSDGSAKIAIIAIERSISAWSVVRQHLPEKSKRIMNLMALLARTRSLADQTFSRAREFHRPGFDDLES